MKYTNVILYIDDCVVILKTKPNAVIKIITYTLTHTNKRIYFLFLFIVQHIHQLNHIFVQESS